VTLALLNTLRDLGIGLFGAGSIAFLAWLELRSGRKHTDQVEREDLEDFATYMQQSSQPQDWAFPRKWNQPAAEYIAKPKARVR
jgi:hypothetical protein